MTRRNIRVLSTWDYQLVKRSIIFTDYKVKFIVHPNYEIKMTNGKRLKANIITAGKVTDATEFELPKYDRIN